MSEQSVGSTGCRPIVIAGLGSIGRRHLANLQRLEWPAIRLFRTGHSTLPDRELEPYAVDRELEAALGHEPVALVVSNPTALHLPVATAGARAGAHLLIEKPVSHTLDGIAELERLAQARALTVLVGFQLRFNPGLRQVKTWLEDGAIGRVASAQVRWGEYLPGMHTWEDYRVGYAARPDLGGGVLLTLCHPFDYLRWLLGDFDVLSATKTATGLLDLRVDSCVDVALRFADGASGQVHLDFLRQPAQHCLELVGTRGTISWTHDDHAARLFRHGTDRWHVVAPPDGFERNQMFLDEMRHFLACIRGAAGPACTLADGRAALEAVLAAKAALARTASMGQVA